VYAARAVPGPVWFRLDAGWPGHKGRGPADRMRWL